ncbi:MAG: class I SAM-dependent methyltransferase [Ignavibacteriae bacterium]|nr:MAG: class I SAM-dependent methyltransferase [Ignavibacteriota bacterium]
MRQWYETLFENYARTYDREEFTQGTVQETDFIEQEIGFDKKKRILDIGCGTGRHAVELAKRGYSVTGIDLSESQLNRAREKALEAGVTVVFEQADARQLKFSDEFDVALILCEGGFSLMETDEMNYLILQGAARALKNGGFFFLTTLNALFPLAHSIEEFINENTVEGKTSGHQFNVITLRDTSTINIADDNGQIRTLHCNERYYMPSEINWMLKSLHFSTVEIFGCQVGNFTRNKPLTPHDYEMLVIAKTA